jgi:hypothetical protein
MSKWRLTRTDMLALLFILVVAGIVVWSAITLGPQPADIFNRYPRNLFIGVWLA